MYNKEKAQERRQVINDSKNWLIMILMVIVEVAILPLLGSYFSGKTSLPQTTIEWILYFACALCSAVCCLMIWLAWHEQGKKNAADHDDYKQAKQLHLENFKRKTKKDIVPVNPFEWEKKQKAKKGIFQTLGIFAGLLGMGLGVITFNGTQAISGIIAAATAMCFGIIHSASVEQMFTEGWLEYELYIKKKLDLEEQTNKFLEEQHNNENPDMLNIVSNI